MKLKDQLTSLKLSKELRKLGVKQESLWYWCIYNKEWFLDTVVGKDKKEFLADLNNYVSAFTCAELGRLLRNVEVLEIIKPFIKPKGANYNWVAIVKKEVEEKVWKIFEKKGKTLVETLAKMLIYLLKNKLI